MKNVISIPLILISLVISACGGSDNNDKSSDSRLGDTAYAGKRTPALLDNHNTLYFVNALLGNPHKIAAFDNAGLQHRAYTADFSGLASVRQFVYQHFTTGNDQTQLIRQARQTNCAQQGSFITEEAPSPARPDNPDIRYTLNNCQLSSDGSSLTGVIQVRSQTNPANQQQKTIYYLQQLSAHHHDSVRVYSGSLSYTSTQGKAFTTAINLSERDTTTGKTNLMDQVIYYDNPKQDQLTGKVYLHDHGYITLQEESGLTFGKDHISLAQGRIMLKAASHSRAIIRSLPERYSIRLDQDGDGQFEQVAVQSESGLQQETQPHFSTTIPPQAIISETYKGGGAYDRTPYINKTIPLYSASEDLDTPQDELRLTWTLESKPAGSQASLPEQHARYNSLYLDSFGDYRISLKVIDADGNTDIAFREYKVYDHPPKIYFYRNATTSVGQKTPIRVGIQDMEEPEAAATNYDYQWQLLTPAGSDATLTEIDSRQAEFTPQRAGNYTVLYQVTDNAGNTNISSTTIRAE